MAPFKEYSISIAKFDCLSIYRLVPLHMTLEMDVRDLSWPPRTLYDFGCQSGLGVDNMDIRWPSGAFRLTSAT